MAKTDTTTYLMYGVGAYLLYVWYTGHNPLDSMFGGGGGAGAAPGQIPAGGGQAQLPAPRSGGSTSSGSQLPAQGGQPGEVPVSQPPPAQQQPPAQQPSGPDRTSIRNQMLSLSSGDPFPMNLWRWGYYYNRATGYPAPDIDWYKWRTDKGYPGQPVGEVEQIVLSIDDWFDLAENYAVNQSNPSARGGWNVLTGGFSGMGGMGYMYTRSYAAGAYPIAAMPNRVANHHAMGLEGNGRGRGRGRTNGAPSPPPHDVFNPWGQDSSGLSSEWDWATPRHMSRGRNL